MNITVADAPHLSELDAVRLARDLYGVEASARSLPSERDQNFHLTPATGRTFVLKVANATESAEVLDFQNRAIEHLAAGAGTLAVPRVVPALSGDQMTQMPGPDGRLHFVRLLTYVPGVCLANVRPHSRHLLRSLGRQLGEMDRVLSTFAHPAMHRPLQWDLKHTDWIGKHLEKVADRTRRLIVERCLSTFDSSVAPTLAGLRAGVIHNDWNDYNVLVESSASPERMVVGAIDFGDMVHSHTICDLAIAAAYAMLDKPDPIAAAAFVVSGYHEVLPLLDRELVLLFDLIRCRLCISGIMATRQHEVAADNSYLQISERQAWALLERLGRVAPQWAHYVFRHACGLEPCPSTSAVVSWLERHRGDFAPVVQPDPAVARSVVFDLSVGSADFGLTDLQDTATLTEALFTRMRKANAQVGIGQYDEARLLYASDLFTQAGHDGPERRTVHLGVDLFVEPGTPIFAPFDATVHSFANNAAPLDYGPTIILEHRTGEEGTVFHTLYGHLSTESLGDLRAGVAVPKGSRIGAVGAPPANGGWPPHLHFQLITDLTGRSGDFPGVSTPAQRDVFLSICPDPNLVLRIPRTCFPARRPAAREILDVRRRHIGPSLSLSYRQPLTIVRGHKQYLWDENGREFLDAVNNVPHVGHCHPRVVGAAQAQMAVLNTNTRYLHELLTRYAERLTATLPDPLSVCFFVCSGSEANELALRLARAHTGQCGMIVLEGAYHGNTSALVEISPYKFDGPGGAGAPRHVQKVPMPDPYRGAHRGAGPSVGARYAEHVSAAIGRLREAGHNVAGFIAESLLSCGGQIVLPAGYLASAYRAVRASGGVCIADEVQVGFGRVGTHFWGFETQDVVPDIVSVGKPMGNGHPLGAVITRPEIAASFNTGMEYFNTFGGNPVSCAAGLAVLDVLRDEGLQDNALKVGAHLKQRLESLMGKHPIIGEVRGLGLFLGVELVLDRARLTPAPRQASYVIERMKEHGVLLSTDGPLHNVLKVKPPMVFSRENADRLVDTLDEILSEDCARAD